MNLLQEWNTYQTRRQIFARGKNVLGGAALASLFGDRPVRHDVAMTGEISLRGLVLPVGGIKEKVLAAQRAGVTRVLLPARNRKDLHDVPESTRQALRFVWLDHVDGAIEAALERRKYRGASDFSLI